MLSNRIREDSPRKTNEPFTENSHLKNEVNVRDYQNPNFQSSSRISY